MTTRTTRLLALILVSVAACGDDGGNTFVAECGDGMREGAEQCDDGNTASGDGCSAQCATELTMSCGNGAVEGTEQCDDSNVTNGDGCSSMCQTEISMPVCGDNNVTHNETCDDGNTQSGDGCASNCQLEPSDCGNGAINSPETCDDGNTTAGDGCSAVCATEPGYTCTGTPSVCTMPTPAGTCVAPFVVNLTASSGVLTGTGTGNTTTSTNQVPMATCSGIDATTGAGKDHVWRFTTTDVRDITIEVPTTNTFDTVLRILAVPCDPAMDVDEFTGADGCDDSDTSASGELLEYTALPAGTYYVVIDGYSANVADAGAYTFTVTARPTLCGNGALDPISAIPGTDEEFCDDMDLMSGDGCNARCEVEPGFTCNAAEPSVCTPTCGNGVLNTGETCDDTNTAAGDGCSATCQTENGFTCTGTPSVCTAIVCGNGIIQTGEMCDDTNTTVGDGCNATCQIEAGFTCTGTPSVCTSTCGNGTLQVTEECEDGNMVSGDRCSSTCTLEFDTAESAEPNNTTPVVLTAGNHILRGALTAGDVDLYTFTLNAPATVHMETYNSMDGNNTNYNGLGNLNPNIDCFTDDTELRLFDSTGNPATNTTALYLDDDDGDLRCSYIGPRDGNDGTAGTNPNEGVLPAGTYTIKVNLFSNTETTTRYLIDLRITSAIAVPPVLGDLVLNEYMAADGTTADTNCDGVTTGTNDEFIELVNVSTTKVLDLGGLQIHDSATVSLRHTFPAGTLLAPGKALVVWSGGAPACAGVPFFATTASGLGLNDAPTVMESIIVRKPGAPAVDLVSTNYTTTTAGISDTRSPELTGAFVRHNVASGAVGSFSPGKRADGTAF